MTPFLYLLNIISLFDAVRSDVGCSYGSFEENNAECMFNCEFNNNYVNISTLSFEQVRNACNNVKRAIKYNGCTANDLVYRNDTCDCPFCKCAASSSNLYERLGYQGDPGPSKECLHCSCKASTYNGIDDMIFVCDQMAIAQKSTDWNEYMCPPNTCIAIDYTYNGTAYVPDNIEKASGNIWWSDGTETSCTELCYCLGNGSAVCATGYDDIMSSQQLKQSFIEKCGASSPSACYVIDAQSYNTSRLYSRYSGPECNNFCPYCDCGGYNVGDKWWHEWQELTDLQEGFVRCAQCECRDAGSNMYYASCQSSYNRYKIGMETCDATIYHQCHVETSNSETVGAVTTNNCTNDNDWYVSKDRFCSWQFSDGYSWNCGLEESVYCEAYFNNQCGFTNTTLTQADCYGKTYEFPYIIYQKCCIGPNCNYENISLSECTHNQDFENLWRDFYQCLYGNDSIWTRYNCDDNVTEITCDALEELFTESILCQCQLYAAPYARVSHQTQQILQTGINDALIRYTDWNDVLQCNINITCDLSTATVINNGMPLTTESIGSTQTGTTNVVVVNTETTKTTEIIGSPYSTAVSTESDTTMNTINMNQSNAQMIFYAVSLWMTLSVYIFM